MQVESEEVLGWLEREGGFHDSVRIQVCSFGRHACALGARNPASAHVRPCESCPYLARVVTALRARARGPSACPEYWCLGVCSPQNFDHGGETVRGLGATGSIWLPRPTNAHAHTDANTHIISRVCPTGQ